MSRFGEPTSPLSSPPGAALDWSRLQSTAMIWLTAAMVSLSLLILLGFLGVLLWFSGSWISTLGITSVDPVSSDGALGRFWLGLTTLLSGGQADVFSAPLIPAIIGTSIMIIVMSIIVAPLGVVVAIYLREYAGTSWYTNAVRISVQNMAGVPSIIYGVFGLGFFVYVVGGQVDELFYAEQLPTPTFGTPGLLWASLTLAMLTLPVVIVSAEEGLARLPESLREGSLALGATRAETIFFVLLPAAAPSVLTGIIMAIARAAGEVAPLMLVGVVKYAPTLPVSLQAPFVHLERKFMHLGFYVYDTAMHDNTGDGRLGLICAASLLLVAVVMTLNLTAILLRKRLIDRCRKLSGL